MEDQQLIRRLNWFYTLEVTQRDIYLSQSKAIDDVYFQNSLERMAFIEQEHVDNLARTIIALGDQPNVIGDVFSPIVGMTMGKLLAIPDFMKSFKYNIDIEAKAARDYQALIKDLEDEGKYLDTIHTLKFNMVDEDLHAAWFAAVLRRGKKKYDFPLSVNIQADYH